MTHKQPSRVLFKKGKYPHEKMNDEMKVYYPSRATYIIESPSGKVYMYDTGRFQNVHTETIPFLKGLGITEIEAIFISHYHRDHTGGCAEIIRAFNGNVKKVFSSGLYSHPDAIQFREEDLPRQEMMFKALARYNIPHVFAKQGDVISDPNIHIEVFNPTEANRQNPDRPLTSDEMLNGGHSICVKFEHGNFSFWGVGDIYQPTLIDDVFSTYTTNPTLMQFPHHGDQQNAFDDFVLPLSPDLFFVDNPLSYTQTVRNYLDSINQPYYDQFVNGRLEMSGNVQDDWYTFKTINGWIVNE